MGISKNKMPHRPTFIFFLLGVLDFCCSCQVLNERSLSCQCVLRHVLSNTSLCPIRCVQWFPLKT
jgi:hypothetical protein